MKSIGMAITILSLLLIPVAIDASRSSASISRQLPKESKEQPKKVTLGTDSLDDKWGEVSFDHENHTLKNYTPDAKATSTCVQCHHTDQPKANLKPPLVTSERTVVLTAEVLKDSSAAPVKTCRACHLQAGDESKPLPVISKGGKPLKLDNENACHINCFDCHDAAIKARPDLATKISGSDPKGCVKCHVAK